MLAERMANSKVSGIMAGNLKVKKLISKGIDIISLTVGEPDFDTPLEIRKVAIEAINNGFTRYTPVAGIPELREAISLKLQKDNRLKYSPEEICVTVGAKQALFNAVMVLCDKGDEVIIPSPYYSSYLEQVILAGAVPVVISGPKELNYKITEEELNKAITSKTKMLVLNSPHNPTGAVYSRSELQLIAEVCLKNKIYVLADEVYEMFIFDGKEHVSIASLNPEIKDITITVNGFSKTLTKTGWRLGYAAGPLEIIKAMSSVQSNCTSGANSITQKAAVKALSLPKQIITEQIDKYDQRRRYLIKRLNKIPGITLVPPEGAFYVFPDITQLFGKRIGEKKITNSEELFEILLNKAHVGLIAGKAFGIDDNVRISYASSIEKIKQGLDRIEEVLLHLK